MEVITAVVAPMEAALTVVAATTEARITVAVTMAGLIMAAVTTEVLITIVVTMVEVITAAVTAAAAIMPVDATTAAVIMAVVATTWLLLWQWLGLGLGPGLLRLWLGSFSWRRLAGLLRRRWVLRLCPGLRRTCVRRSGGVCRPDLRHRGLRQPGLHDSGLPNDGASCSYRRRERGARNAHYDQAGLYLRTPRDLHRPDLRQLIQTDGDDVCCHHLHPGQDHPGMDAAACPGIRSNLQLDGSAERDCLLRHRPIGRHRAIRVRTRMALSQAPARAGALERFLGSRRNDA